MSDLISRQAVLDMQYRIDDSATLSTRDVVNVDDIEDLPPVNPQKWIPVSERLPENRIQEVLISLEWGIDIGRYSDGEWHSEWVNRFDDGNVLAWMPLPEPYKDGGE